MTSFGYGTVSLVDVPSTSVLTMYTCTVIHSYSRGAYPLLHVEGEAMHA